MAENKKKKSTANDEKDTSLRRERKDKTRTKKEQRRIPDGLHKSIPIILLAFAVFTGVCFIASGVGAFGAFLSDFLLGLFSHGAYAVPFLIAVHALFYIQDVRGGKLATRFAFSVLTLVAIATTVYTVQYWNLEKVFLGSEYYALGAIGVGGGLIGSSVGYALAHLFGNVGVIITASAVFAIYITYFFSGGKRTLGRAGFSFIKGIVTVLAFLERKLKSLFSGVKGIGARRRMKKIDEKNRDLFRDDYFDVDNGIESLHISELGISEKRSRESIESRPSLQDKVYRKSDYTDANAGEEHKADYIEVEPDEEVIYTQPRRERGKVYSYDFDGDGQGARSDPFFGAEEKKPRTVTEEPSADAIFTKAFDPFSLAMAEEMATKPSSRAVSEGLGTVSEDLGDLTEEQIERARRNAAFEKRKAQIIGNARRAAEADASRQEVKEAPQNTEAYQPEQATSYEEEATNAYEPNRAEVYESEPQRSERKSFGFTEIRNDKASLPGEEDEVVTIRINKTEDADRHVDGFTSETDKRDEIYVAHTVTKEFEVKEESREDIATPSYTEDRTEYAHNGTSYSSADGGRTDFRPFEDKKSSAAVFDFDSFDDKAPIEEKQETLTVERTILGHEREEQYEDESAYTEPYSELENSDADESDDAFDGGDSLAEQSFEDEEEEAPVTVQPEEDIPEGDEEIPPEKQNPAINGYRDLFTIFRDKKEEEKEEEANEVPADSTSDAEACEEETPFDEGAEDVCDDEPLPFEREEVMRAQAARTATPSPSQAPKKEEPKTEAAKPDYSNYKAPPIDLLGLDPMHNDDEINAEINQNTNTLIETLASFNVTASIKGVDRGPRVTRYEVVPARGVKVNAITGLFDNIAMNLAAEGIRMEAPIPGKSAIGFEIPNKHPQNVRLRELLECEEFVNAKSKTMVCIGKDVGGNPVFGDIGKFPHALVAGATGMGKSVCINSIMISLLYKARPDEVKFIMIDPKKVEFRMYSGIPHLLIPVITEAKQAAGALMWAVEEMERRYSIIEPLNIRTIESYNERCAEDKSLGEPLPKIVIVIDELNDLMMQVRDPVEDLIMRIAQKARAAGIHLIIGTQRPDVKVITGTIKANINTRISCKVTSVVDSRTILEMSGAEKLLNRGDMLFKPVDKTKPIRVQGCFVTDAEVERIMDYLKNECDGNVYNDEIYAEINRAAQKCGNKKSQGGFDEDGDDGDDSVGYYGDQQFLDAVELAIRAGKVSTSLLQRKLSIGYGKAAKFIDAMEDIGIVSAQNGMKPRDILLSMDEWHEKLSRVNMDEY